jgi:uncharacterized DUF497 family protein
MRIKDIIWLPNVVDKLDWKHGVMPDEVEELFAVGPQYRRIERGNVRGEDVYAAMGQTEAGRYLIVFFIHKQSGAALVISARDMTLKERKRYGRSR